MFPFGSIIIGFINSDPISVLLPISLIIPDLQVGLVSHSVFLGNAMKLLMVFV